MRGQFEFKRLNNYPHLKPEDVFIWERFLGKFPGAYDSVDYDFGVGALPEFSRAVVQEIGVGELSLYKKKIDVVGYKGDQPDIIEVKPNASASALGQLWQYGVLYKNYFNPDIEPKLVLITNRILPDMNLLAYTLGIKIVVV